MRTLVILTLLLASTPLIMAQGCLHPMPFARPGEGGGASDDDSGDEGTAALQVDAGADQTAVVGQSLTLRATVRGGREPYAYEWRQLAGASATLAGATSASATATFLAAGTYWFQVTVEDAAGNRASDTLFVTVTSGVVVTGS